MYKPEHRIVVYDFETTGFSPDNDQPIEICAKTIEKDGSHQNFHCLVSCEKPLPEKIIEITGITDDMLSQHGIPYQDAMNKFIDFLQLDEAIPFLVGHNAIRFDINFLMKGIQRCNRNPLVKFEGWDTAGHFKAIGLNMSRLQNETILRWHDRALKQVVRGFYYKLTQCCDEAGIKSAGAHRADADVEMTLQLFLHQYGQHTGQNLLTLYIQNNEQRTTESNGIGNNSGADDTTVNEGESASVNS